MDQIQKEQIEKELLAKMQIKNILQSGEEGQKVSVFAWLRSKRDSKNVVFLVLNDGTCFQSLQAVVDTHDPKFHGKESLWDELSTGVSVHVEGELKASPAKGQKWEILASQVTLLGGCDPKTYPMQKKGHTLEFLREICHLRLRSNTFGAVFRIRNTLSFGVHNFFQQKGFIWAHTPIITSSDCEGAGELFQINSTLDTKEKSFFGKQAYLTVSGQLHGECMAMALSNIYTFGPTFRAENSNTARHLSEFWMIEPEMAFCDLEANMTMVESFLKSVIRDVLNNNQEDLEFFESFYKNTSIQTLEKLTTTPFGRVSYTEAIELLLNSTKSFEYPVSWGMDLQTEHERYLAEEVFKGPVFVYNFPKDIKAFYMRLNEDGKTVAAMDLLVPGVGELVGGSQREERLENLEKRMLELGMNPEELSWYLDLRRFGTCVHSGFGLGFERLIMYVTGMSNIRDVILSPRAPGLVRF